MPWIKIHARTGKNQGITTGKLKKKNRNLYSHVVEIVKNRKTALKKQAKTIRQYTFVQETSEEI